MDDQKFDLNKYSSIHCQMNREVPMDGHCFQIMGVRAYRVR